MSAIVTLKEEENYCLIQMDDGKANAFSFAMMEQLNAALDKVEETGKVLIITGRAGKFSAGFDLNVMMAGGEGLVNMLSEGAKFASRVINAKAPVILAVSGHALAMGALLLGAGDYRIGIKGNFKIGLNEVAIGMPLPYFGLEIIKPRLAPQAMVKSLELARIYDAPGAVEIGYLDEAVDEDQLLDRAIAVANDFATLNMQAYQMTKSRMRGDHAGNVLAGLEKDVETLS